MQASKRPCRKLNCVMYGMGDDMDENIHAGCRECLFSIYKVYIRYCSGLWACTTEIFNQITRQTCMQSRPVAYLL